MACDKQLKLLSLNLAFWAVSGRDQRLERLAERIASEEVDLVLLQEVAGGLLMFSDDTAQNLQYALRRHGVFMQRRTDFAHKAGRLVQVGNAILSRCPIEKTYRKRLPPILELKVLGLSFEVGRSVLSIDLASLWTHMACGHHPSLRRLHRLNKGLYSYRLYWMRSSSCWQATSILIDFRNHEVERPLYEALASAGYIDAIASIRGTLDLCTAPTTPAADCTTGVTNLNGPSTRRVDYVWIGAGFEIFPGQDGVQSTDRSRRAWHFRSCWPARDPAKKGWVMRVCLAILAFFWSPFAPSAEARSPQTPPGYTLVFQDEMTAPVLDARYWITSFERWNIRHLEGNEDKAFKVEDRDMLANGERVRDVLEGLTERPGPFLHEVSGGTLKLRAFPLPERLYPAFEGFPFAGSMISMENSHAQRFGYWEVRLRLNRFGKGHHLAVWLLPDDGTWPPEIDLFEAIGEDDRFFANAHLIENEGHPGISWVDGSEIGDDWLIIGFQWTDLLMRWTINGKTVRRQLTPEIDQAMYFLMSWEIGSRWPGMPDQSTPWPGEVEVDYVRIYERGAF